MNQQYLKYEDNVNIIPNRSRYYVEICRGDCSKVKWVFFSWTSSTTQNHDTFRLVLYVGHEIIYLFIFLSIYIYIYFFHNLLFLEFLVDWQ